MPNPNYAAGVRFEREVLAARRDRHQCEVMRTSGSHGLFDLIAIRPNGQVELIQCKRVRTERDAARMITDWQQIPPLGCRPLGHYYQILAVKIKGRGDWKEVCV